MNTFGKLFTLTTFGESHGPAIGGILDGVPSGFHISEEEIQAAMSRRRPGNISHTSARKESDTVEILSGLDPSGMTLGSPIGFMIRNRDHKKSDYDGYAGKFRPNHADFTYFEKYGINPQPGGGRSSARETACRVAAGSVASQILSVFGIEAKAYISAIDGISLADRYSHFDRSEIRPENFFCPDPRMIPEINELLTTVAFEGDSIGGIVSCVISGVPTGIGEPVYGKLQARLAEGMMSINAAKGFEYGLGFGCATARGSRTADIFSLNSEGKIITTSNHSGGIQGGISNGNDICLSVAFKPTPTIMRPLPTVGIDGNPAELLPKGRHDCCVAIRAVPVVEAMANLVIADMMLIAGKLTRQK